MNPEILKYLQQLTASLRGGLVFNPLTEIQKRATQFGEGVGTDLEKNRAQASYARAHPESSRAQQEMMTNAATMALSLGAGGEGAGEKPTLRAAIKVPGRGIVEGTTHGEAYAKAGIYDPLPPRNEGFIDQNNKYYTRQSAEKLMDKWLSPAVKGQIAQRKHFTGTDTGITTEDVTGKLYKNYGTQADPSITADEFNDIVARAKKGRAAMDSVASFAPQVIKQLQENGGFTVHPQTGEPVASGYAVGGGNQSGALLKVPVAELTPERLDRWLAKNRSKFPKNANLGGWVDEHGVAHIKPSENVADLNEAQRLGNSRDQISIWDHANNAEIPLKRGKAEAAAKAENEFQDTLNKWRSAWTGFQDVGEQVRQAPEQHRLEVKDALENPSHPQTPFTTAVPQLDIERPNGASPDKIARVESMAYDTFRSPQFRKWLEAGQGTGNWYDTRKTQARAIVALGDKLGPEAFNELIDHMAASTAMSRPENNLRRASWWRALNLQGMLNPTELRSATLAAPEGMGHIAQRAHHFATADLVESGQLNKLANPKPASFAENLKMNWRPITFDTRMSNATLATQPEMSVGLAGVKDAATPRKWAYAPIERAAQQVASEAAKRGDLGDLPAGVDPTAAWQAQVWGGIGRTDKTHMMSANNPNFHEILDRLLKRSAEMWGVTPGVANDLFWKGQPLDLPLDARLTTGPARMRKK